MFNINQTYKFETLAPSILGISVSQAKVISTSNYAGAIAKDSNIANLHQTLTTVIDSLPKPEDCVFTEFELQDGTKVVLAHEYINISTVELSNTSQDIIVIKVQNTSDLDASIISARLKELGYKNFSLERISS